MSIYFIRHGESEANLKNYFAGALNSPLTPLGSLQAHQAAKQIRERGLDFDEVHISALERTRDTANIILADDIALHANIVFTDQLIERDFGIFAGQNKTLLKKALGYKRFNKFIHDPSGRPRGGESWMDMYVRCKNYYDTVLRPLDESGKRVLVVAHKYIVEVFALIASGRQPSEYIDFRLPNSRPLSWEDLTTLTARSSAALNITSEYVEINLSAWTLVAAILGLFLGLLNAVVSSYWAELSIVVLLAVNSIFLALRIDPKAIALSRGSKDSAFIIFYVFQISVCIILLLIASSRSAHLVGLFLIMPPALVAPIFSLSRGGDYFFATRNTLILSTISPFLIIITNYYVPNFDTDSDGIKTFLFILIFAIAIPIFFSQKWRKKNPIKAGNISTNWSWLGTLTMIPLAFIIVFSVSNHAQFGENLLRGWEFYSALALPFIVLSLLRIGSTLYMRLWEKFQPKKISQSVAIDLKILQITPNIFLWLGLLSCGIRNEYSIIIVGITLGFFLFNFIYDIIIIFIFRSILNSMMVSLLIGSHL